MNEFILALSICAILFSFITLVISIIGIGYVVGLKNSTHQIQFVDPNAPTGEELAKEIAESEKKVDEGVYHI